MPPSLQSVAAHTLAEQANLHAFASVCIYKQAICHSKQYVSVCCFAQRLSEKSLKKDILPSQNC